jgi:hypothetical protein
MPNWTPRIATAIMKQHVVHQEAISKNCKALFQLQPHETHAQQRIFYNLRRHDAARKACVEAALNRDPSIAFSVFAQIKPRKTS